jgi:hypothetical protein
MRRTSTLMTLVALIAAVGALAADAHAQYRGYGRPRGRTGPYDRPIISPYATLSGLSGEALVREYYRRVRPEVELRNAATQQYYNLQNLQQQVNRQQSLIQSQNSQISPTGHATWFLNHSQYFGAGGR